MASILGVVYKSCPAICRPDARNAPESSRHGADPFECANCCTRWRYPHHGCLAARNRFACRDWAYLGGSRIQSEIKNRLAARSVFCGDKRRLDAAPTKVRFHVLTRLFWRWVVWRVVPSHLSLRRRLGDGHSCSPNQTSMYYRTVADVTSATII